MNSENYLENMIKDKEKAYLVIIKDLNDRLNKLEDEVLDLKELYLVIEDMNTRILELENNIE